MDRAGDSLLPKSASDESPQIGDILLHSSDGPEPLRQDAFDRLYERRADAAPWWRRLNRRLKDACCRKRRMVDAVAKVLPCVDVVRTYKIKQYLLADLIAGLSVSILHLSQGMGYSVLCGLPPVYGIYVSFFHPLLYFLFGTSRHLSVGTFSLTSLMVGAVISREVERLAVATSPLPLPAAAAASATLPMTTMSWKTPSSQFLANATGHMLLNDSASSSGSTDGDTTAAFADAANPVAIRVQLAVCLSLLIGVFQLLLGLLRFGFITSYLSPTFVGGFTCASALHIANSQVRFAAFGRRSYITSSSGAFKFFKIWYELFANVAHANWLCAVSFLISCAILLAVKQGINKNPRLRHRLLVPVPVDFVVVVVATLLSRFLDFESVPTHETGVLVIGVLPHGLPAPSVPELAMASRVIADAFLIAVVNYLFNYSMANFFEEKYKYKSDDSQELVASGLLHVVGSFFSCFPGAASPPRCFMQDSSGCKTQLCGLVSCVVMAVVLYAVGPYLYWLPFPVIAALIVVSLKRLLLQFRDLRPLFAHDKVDFAIWIVTFGLTLCLDIDYGMMAGIVLSLLATAARMQLKPLLIVGELRGGAFESSERYEVRRPDESVLVLKYEAPLLYPNADRFRKLVLQAVKQHFTPSEPSSAKAVVVPATSMVKDDSRGPACLPSSSFLRRTVIIDCSFVSCVDVAGVRSLKKLHKALQCADVTLQLAACSLSVRDSLRAAAPEIYQLAFVNVKAGMAAALAREESVADEVTRV